MVVVNLKTGFLLHRGPYDDPSHDLLYCLVEGAIIRTNRDKAARVNGIFLFKEMIFTWWCLQSKPQVSISRGARENLKIYIYHNRIFD